MSCGALAAAVEGAGEERLGPAPAALSRPGQWDEVDAEELERIALAIARNAMPQSSENSDIAARMAAQLAAAQMDQLDILGLGRIDTQNCSLVPALRPPPCARRHMTIPAGSYSSCGSCGAGLAWLQPSRMCCDLAPHSEWASESASIQF